MRQPASTAWSKRRRPARDYAIPLIACEASYRPPGSAIDALTCCRARLMGPGLRLHSEMEAKILEFLEYAEASLAGEEILLFEDPGVGVGHKDGVEARLDRGIHV